MAVILSADPGFVNHFRDEILKLFAGLLISSTRPNIDRTRVGLSLTHNCRIRDFLKLCLSNPIADLLVAGIDLGSNPGSLQGGMKAERVQSRTG